MDCLPLKEQVSFVDEDEDDFLEGEPVEEMCEPPWSGPLDLFAVETGLPPVGVPVLSPLHPIQNRRTNHEGGADFRVPGHEVGLWDSVNQGLGRRSEADINLSSMRVVRAP